MYIEKLQINSFGKLSDLTLELAPGINIIEGANESGKSTIAAFIKFMFYGIPAKERASLVSWSTGGAAGTLTLDTGSHRYRIERALACTGGDKPSWRESVQLVDLANNMPCHKGESPGELFFGVDADMFSATAFISQLGGTDTGGTKVAEGIENLLFSADETVNTQRALSRLDAARVLLLHKNEKGGRLYELENECAALESKLSGALETSRDILAKEAQLADLRRSETAAREKSERLTKKLEQFEARTIVKLYERMHSLENKVEALRGQLESSGAPDSEDLRRLQSAAERIDSLRSQLDELEARCASSEAVQPDAELDEYSARGGREGISDEIGGCRSTAKVQTVVAVVLLVLSLGIISVGLLPLMIGLDPMLWVLIGGGLLLAISVTLFVMSSRSRRRAEELEDEFDIESLEARLERRRGAEESARLTELARADTENRLAEALREAARECSLDEAADEETIRARLDELSEKHRAAGGVKAEYDKYSTLLDGMREQLGGYDESELREKIDDSIDISDIDAENLTAIRRETGFASKSAASLNQHAAELEKRLAALYPTAENPTKLSDRLNALKAERDELSKKHAAYKLAYDKLTEASTNLRESVAPRLASDAAKLMSGVTDGKYSELGVGGTLELSCVTESGTRDIGYLSAGTQDAAYLSLRLALCGMVYRKCTPVMVCDESFSRLDDERLTRLLRMLCSMDQTLVLTSNSRDAGLMRSVGQFNSIKLL